MAFKLEARWRELVELSRAAVNLKHARAESAAEMMVVSLTGHFVSRRFARQLHGREPVVLKQRGDGSVHRGYAQPFHMISAGLKHFGGAQRPSRILKNAANRVPLSCSTFHYQ